MSTSGRALRGAVVRHHRSAIVAAAALLVVWAAAAAFRVAGPRTVLNIDLAWNTWIGHARSPALVQAADVLAFIGTGLPAVVITLVAAAVAGLLTRRAVMSAYVVVVSGVSAADTWLMKMVAARLRPDPVHFTSATSFPSGHTANAAALAVAIAVLTGRRTVWAASVAYIAAMGFSRTVLHAHWITDVVAGGAAGAATAVLARVAMRLGAPPQAVTAPSSGANATTAPRPTGSSESLPRIGTGRVRPVGAALERAPSDSPARTDGGARCHEAWRWSG